MFVISYWGTCHPIAGLLLHYEYKRFKVRRSTIRISNFGNGILLKQKKRICNYKPERLHNDYPKFYYLYKTDHDHDPQSQIQKYMSFQKPRYRGENVTIISSGNCFTKPQGILFKSLTTSSTQLIVFKS